MRQRGNGGGDVCWDSRLDFPSKLLRLLIHAGQEDIQTVFGQNDLEQVAARAAEKKFKTGMLSQPATMLFLTRLFGLLCTNFG